MPAYNPKLIEQKWQRLWEKSGLYTTDIANATKPFYNLMMFPYPSGEGLHVGHAYAFSGADVYGRFQKMLGNEVFEPMGFDAFGIHSENYAIKVGKHPAELIEHTTAHYEEQLRKLGNMYDWSHKLSTTDPNYYKWTQWLFLQLYKHGLAERKEADVNWCPSCKTVLADEQVITGRCERCDTETTRKKLKQWFLKITKYQERLLANLDHIDWSEKVKAAQRNWIGKSEGATIHFAVNMPSAGNAEAQKPTTISVFTTRPDTLFGATYLVLAPEHPLAQQIAHSSKSFFSAAAANTFFKSTSYGSLLPIILPVGWARMSSCLLSRSSQPMTRSSTLANSTACQRAKRRKKSSLGLNRTTTALQLPPTVCVTGSFPANDTGVRPSL
ncbi:MAG: Leucine-tRNA ligase [Parcubacteria group bacterium GW2011_GWA2_47_8]|nr:MAG: Leucine-tRNA ligase [Parcubacteria group bacterium GW2011_GWA2_47_8]